MKSFFLTLLFVMAAELCDKTQLVIISMVRGSTNPRATFLGAVLGFILATALALFLVDNLIKVIPLSTLNRAIGVIFLIVGVFILWRG